MREPTEDSPDKRPEKIAANRRAEDNFLNLLQRLALHFLEKKETARAYRLLEIVGRISIRKNLGINLNKNDEDNKLH